MSWHHITMASSVVLVVALRGHPAGTKPNARYSAWAPVCWPAPRASTPGSRGRWPPRRGRRAAAWRCRGAGGRGARRCCDVGLADDEHQPAVADDRAARAGRRRSAVAARAWSSSSWNTRGAPRLRVRHLLDRQDLADVAVAHRLDRRRTGSPAGRASGRGRSCVAAPPLAARCGSGRPVDLGVGLAQVHGWISAGLTHSSRSARAWASCTSGPARRVGCSAKSQWKPSRISVAVAQRAVADAQHVLAAGQQVGRRGRRRARPAVRPTCCTPPGTWPVQGVEQLALAGVDDGHDDAVGVAQRERQQVERRDADHRHPQRLGERLAGGQADAHAGEQPGSDVDGDDADLVEPDVGLGAHELDRRGQRLGVAAARGRPRTGRSRPRARRSRR